MFLAYFSVFRLMSIVGRALQTTRTHGFGLMCVALGANQGGVDDELVEGLVTVQHPRQYRGYGLDEPFWMTRDKEGGCQPAGAQCIWNPTYFLPFSFRRLLQDPRSCFRPLNDARGARPPCARHPFPFDIHRKGI